jgi:hypothetical protein
MTSLFLGGRDTIKGDNNPYTGGEMKLKETPKSGNTTARRHYEESNQTTQQRPTKRRRKRGPRIP